jgi:lysophospholipase L1-like esterase
VGTWEVSLTPDTFLYILRLLLSEKSNQENLMNGRKYRILFHSLFLLLPAVLQAQLVEKYEPPRSNGCLASFAQMLADQLQDWNQLGRYHEDNIRLQNAAAEANRVVFLGDSITDGWKLELYFPGKPYVNRGIGGQTTPQMLVRFYPDAINLKPAAVVILAGTNDIARNTGPQTAEMVQDNIRAMSELAARHDIAVVLCSVTPISDYARSKQSEQRPPSDILRLNVWLKEYAGQTGATYVDYFSTMADMDGFLKKDISDDGLHPNEKGYAIMAPIVQAAIEKTLKQ